MALLGAAEILAADDRSVEMVDCPEWGGEVRIATMTGTERDEFEAEVYGNADSGKSALERHIRVLLVAYCAVDAEGRRLFTDRAEIEALGRKSFKPIRRIAEVAMRLNALTEAAVEDLEKNS
jgi:hypothetical protein